MKRFIWTLLLAPFLFSCSKDGGSSTSVAFRKADLSGASMLALASAGPDTKAEGDLSTKSVLWKVSPDGSMIEVTYTIEVKGAKGQVAETFQKNGRLTMENVYPVGNDWLWLANARIDCPDLSESEMWKIGIDTEPFNYLLRRKDGALFRWFDEKGGEGNTLWIGEQGESLVAVQAQDKDIAPFIGSFGGDIYAVLGRIMSGFINGFGNVYASMLDNLQFGFKPFGSVWKDNTEELLSLVKLSDKGQELEMVSLMPSNIRAWLCLVTPGGLIGSTVSYENSGSWAHIIFDPKTGSIKLIQIPDGFDLMRNTSLVMVNGELYLITRNSGEYGAAFYKVDAGGNTTLTASYSSDYLFRFPSSFVYRSQTASWVADGRSFVFDPNAKSLTSKELPAHYPAQERDYYNGVACVVEETGVLPSSFYKCDLSSTSAEVRSVLWSAEAQSYASQTVPGRSFSFLGSSMTLVKTASLVDGRSVIYYIDVATNIGTCMVSGSSQSGQVVSTLIRLN